VTTIPGVVVLEEVVGSQAYGLATEASDTDRLGVFVAPTSEIVSLNWNRHRNTVVGKDETGDFAAHEIGKATGLWLGCNPTVTELLWMGNVNGQYDVPFYRPDLLGGWVRSHLRRLRTKFLSTSAVVNAYGGYARQQALKLAKRDDGSFSSATRKRTAKHARHCMRLLLQGEELLLEGELTVDCSGDREWLFAMGHLAETNVGEFMKRWDRQDAKFKQAAAKSVLPDKPDKEAANRFLVTVRKACWDLPCSS
jgi:uncharacterized protein